ncbi:MAG TPA: vWA domain-containing protein [Planctomycetota bacterium]
MGALRRLIGMAGLGGFGALLGGLLGEVPFLLPSPEPTAPSRRHVCLVFDTSESMARKTTDGVRRIVALEEAARGFLARPELAGDTLSLVAFSDEARVRCPPSAAALVAAALDGLPTRGRTDIPVALDTARAILGAAPGEERWILLFTDGKPQTARPVDPIQESRRAAQACRDAGVRILCVATGGADQALLEELAGEPEHVLVAQPEALGSAFERSVGLIENRQMLASQPDAIDLGLGLRRACAWAALVALGAGIALVAGHERHLRRRALPAVGQLVRVLLGAGATGLVAGLAGQGAFHALSGGALLEPLLRAGTWILLGAALVLGMSAFVPNLPRTRALAGGALGGAAAVSAFLHGAPLLGDTAGRLLGALVLGLTAGAATVLVEASVRRAWLVVRWPGGETSRLLLGPQPIVVGHSARAHICPAFDEERAPVIGLFTHRDGEVRFEDRRSGQVRRLRGGERLNFEPVLVEVHGERLASAPRAPAA